MSLEGEAVTKIAELAQRAESKDTAFKEVEGRTYLEQSGQYGRQASLVKPPMAEPIPTASLSGLVEFCNKNHDGVIKEDYFLSIVSPAEVRVLSRLDGAYRTRETILVARHSIDDYPFGEYIDQKEFITRIQTHFDENKELEGNQREAVLSIVGSLKAEMVQENNDDGFTQRASVETETGSKNQSIPNPVSLYPYRSFPEISVRQKFVLRLQNDGGRIPYVGLFEADGGMWRVDAMGSIRKFLSDALDGWPIYG